MHRSLNGGLDHHVSHSTAYARDVLSNQGQAVVDAVPCARQVVTTRIACHCRLPCHTADASPERPHFGLSAFAGSRVRDVGATGRAGARSRPVAESTYTADGCGSALAAQSTTLSIAAVSLKVNHTAQSRPQASQRNSAPRRSRSMTRGITPHSQPGTGGHGSRRRSLTIAPACRACSRFSCSSLCSTAVRTEPLGGRSRIRHRPR